MRWCNLWNNKFICLERSVCCAKQQMAARPQCLSTVWWGNYKMMEKKNSFCYP